MLVRSAIFLLVANNTASYHLLIMSLTSGIRQKYYERLYRYTWIIPPRNVFHFLLAYLHEQRENQVRNGEIFTAVYTMPKLMQILIKSNLIERI